MADLVDLDAPVPSSTLTTLDVEPWPDPVIDQLGHDPRSLYVERFWLGILGPSTILLLRRLADELDAQPGGFRLELSEAARALGLGDRGGRNSPFVRTIDRVCRFGAAEWRGAQTLAVRQHLAPLTRSQLARLSPTLRAQHDRWTTQVPDVGGEGHRQRERARGLALALLDLGEEPSAVERLLHRWQFHPALAHDALRWARARRAGEPDEVTGPVTGPSVAAMNCSGPTAIALSPRPRAGTAG